MRSLLRHVRPTSRSDAGAQAWGQPHLGGVAHHLVGDSPTRPLSASHGHGFHVDSGPLMSWLQEEFPWPHGNSQGGGGYPVGRWVLPVAVSISFPSRGSPHRLSVLACRCLCLRGLSAAVDGVRAALEPVAVFTFDKASAVAGTPTQRWPSNRRVQKTVSLWTALARDAVAPVDRAVRGQPQPAPSASDEPAAGDGRGAAGEPAARRRPQECSDQDSNWRLDPTHPLHCERATRCLRGKPAPRQGHRP